MTIRQIHPLAPEGENPESWQRIRELVDFVNGLDPVPESAAAGVAEKIGGFTAGTWQDLWPGPTDRIPLVTTPENLEVVSTSANNSAAGTGAQQLRLNLLYQDFTEREEIVTLNGVTPVAVPNGPYFRLNSAETIRAGSYGWVQTASIDIRASGGGQVWARMSVDTNEKRSGVFTVPAGREAALVSAVIRMHQRKAGDKALLEAQYRPLGEEWLVIGKEELDDVDSIFQAGGNLAVRYPAGTDIRISCNVTGTPPQISGNFSVNLYTTRP